MSCELGEDKKKHPCPRDANECVTQGNPLHWASSCLSYSVQIDGSPRSKLDADQIPPLVEQAFNAWKSARCPGGGSPSFEVRFQGYVSCNRGEAVCSEREKNANVVMFQDNGWLYGEGRMGVTTPTGGSQSGLVIDADVEINSQDFSFASDPSGMMSSSLFYVLTHELGHFLGIAHSRAPGSVMTESYQSFAFSPNLISPDDAAAVCAAYPPGPKLNCDSRATPTFDACQIPLGEDPPCKLASVTHDAGGCNCHLAANSRRPLPSLAALGLALVVLARRRTRAHRAGLK